MANRSVGVSFKSRLGLHHPEQGRVDLKFYTRQPGKRVAVVTTVFSALTLIKFQGFGGRVGGGLLFKAKFERDPHRPIKTNAFFQRAKLLQVLLFKLLTQVESQVAFWR